MPRKKFDRCIACVPGTTYYKPAGIPLKMLEEVTLAHDEWESIRLADLEGMYHDQAARSMGISRQTFGRILESARKKIALALVSGKAIKIETI